MSVWCREKVVYLQGASLVVVWTHAATMKVTMESLKNTKNRPSHDPAIPPHLSSTSHTHA